MAKSTTSSPASGASNLNSLANNAAKPIGAFDLDANNAVDFSVYVAAQLAASGVSATGSIELYFVGSVDGTNWTDGINPADTADVSAAIKSAERIAVLSANANGQLVEFAVDVSSQVGIGFELCCIIVKNLSGAAIQATGNAANYAATNY